MGGRARRQLDAKPADPHAVHLLIRQTCRVDGHRVARLRAAPERVEHQACHGPRPILRQTRVDGLVEVVDRHRPGDQQRAVVDPGEGVVRQVVLALDLADDLLEDVSIVTIPAVPPYSSTTTASC